MTNLDAQNKAALPEDHILLSTVHQSKGMEWPVVILPWLADSYFPSARSIEDGNLDEERRLFYVAVTRAKDRLYLCAPRSKKTAEGGSFPVEMSQFVREIPSEMYMEHEVRSVSPAYDRPKPSGDRYGGWGGGYGSRGGNGGNKNGGGTVWRTTWRR